MTFRTELIVPPLATPLPPRARVLTIGSCFAAVLGQKLTAAKLPVLENPFGTVLNPVSACRLLAVACGADDFDLMERTVRRDGRWFSYDVPSGISGSSPAELEKEIHTRLAQVREFVRTADALVLTMGTAWAWRLDGEVVANCHKQPGTLFTKSLLSVQETVAAFAEAHSWLLRLNPKLRIALTVSPVRHPKETLTGSSVSKATLRLACHHLAGLVRDVTYFPAYELLLDDLRDYRFFAADMLHPSPLAEDYIFDKFVGAYFDVRFGQAREAWAEIQRAMAHRSSNPKGEEHQRFLLNTLDKLDQLAEQGFDIKAEAETLTSQLVKPRKPVTTPRPEKPEPEKAAPADEKPAKTSASVAPEQPKKVTPVVVAPPTPVGGKPAKPIIRIELPPDALPVRRPERGVKEPLPPKSAPEAAPVVEMPSLPEELPAEVEAQVIGAEAENAASPDNVASPDTAAPRKRRGKRGGKRNKQRREAAALAAQAAVPTPETATNPSEKLPEETSELIDNNSETISSIPETPSALIKPDVDVVAEPVVGIAATTETPQSEGVADATASVDEPIRAAGGNKSGRGGKSKGGTKKLTLQKVKAAPASSTSVEPNASVPAVPEARVSPEAQPAPAAKSRRSKSRKGASARPATTVTAPAEPTETVTAPATPPPPAPEIKSDPVAVVTEQPAPPKERRTARTPSKGTAKGPVATPVEKAQAARSAKKAGVSALLMALGGGNPPPTTPSQPTASKAKGKTPVLEPVAAAAANRNNQTAKNATPAPEPATAAAPEPAPVPEVLKKPAKSRAPKKS